MSPEDAADRLSLTHRRALRSAYAILERPDFAARVGAAVGKPMLHRLKLAPRAVEARLNRAVQSALARAMTIAVRSLSGRRVAHVGLAGASGAVSGFFGPAALALELPVTTVLMLRAIAEVALKHGEDLSSLEARLNCIAVLGLGAEKGGGDAGYYGARAALGRVIADASNLIVERGVVAGAAPAVNAMAGAVAPRFGLVVSERAAASALPALGALGGATLNMLFMRHFERAAHGHFTVRRLERVYGDEAVQAYYRALRFAPAPR